ncbi:P-loop NTPase fold protein [Thalassolituus alkanivorans]|uniref:P-loop NTPase fold protein n=1 Tax=Thalassolituus alkanivorans TaxID=2881055 RepID=UPI001E44106A|nr:P-loop NTPase fold protein [Thalassolituus alkanivorans]MCB2387099.1 hypothetical protein [Thalassolituus alkanivorans]MCB2421455.1 hypothetical protein [Thalassolituus alkanivorans]
MLRHLLSCLQRAVSRLTESRVFTFNSEPEWHISVLRWTTLVFYGWLGAVVVYLLWPWLSYLRPERLFSLTDKPTLYVLLQVTWSLVAVLLVLALQDKFFIRFPRKRQSVYCIDIQTFVRYPTLHVSVVTGILLLLSTFDGTSAPGGSSLLVISSDALQLPVLIEEKETRHLPVLGGDGLSIFFLIYAFILAVRTAYHVRTLAAETEKSRSTEALNLLTCSDSQFEQWLRKEEGEKTLDFFDREPYVERMLVRTEQTTGKKSQRSKGQILLGEFGSGKTTIVNLLEKKLGPEWIVSRFDCWQRSGKPQELAAQLIEQILHDVGQQIEVTSLASLPESFASALYGSSHWWQLLDIWLRPDTPEQVIGKLDSLLKVNNRRLLLVIENVDRNEEREHFINIIAAILDKLQQSKNLNHIDFIFSADEARLDKELLYRIADYRERVATFISPELLIRFMALCLDSALSGRRNGESLIIPYLSKDFLLPGDAQGKIEAVKSAFGIQSGNGKSAIFSKESNENKVLMALTNILSNPRRLKHVLRDMYQRWLDELKGEVNLFDLLLYCTANDEGSIRDGMDKFTEKDLNGSGDNPFLAGTSKKPKTPVDSDAETTADASYGDSDLIAFYLLNGDLAPGHPCRSSICQPVIDKEGVSEDVFEKYRKVVDIGVVKGYASSDQEFLGNYIKASSKSGDPQALAACLNFALSSSHHLVIFENLLISMTEKYFSSVTELYRFSNRAIVLADQRYADTMNRVLNPLIRLCFRVMNFDASGGESHADKLEEKLIAALKNLAEHKQYSYILRSLLFIASSRASDLALRVINTVAKSVFTRDFSNSMADAFEKNEAGTHELQYEYISLLPALEKAEQIIGKESLREACHSFLIVMGIKLTKDEGILAEFAQRYPEKLDMIKEIIKTGIEVTVLDRTELNAWQELLRVLPDAKNTDNSQPQDK